MELNGEYDKDSHEKLTRPKAYKGRLYRKVTDRHKKYLEALGSLGREWVYYHEWTRQCQNMGITTHGNKTPERLSPPMIYGVFKCRGYIKIRKDKETNLNQYCLTDKGKGYLEGLLSRDTKAAQWIWTG